METASFSNWQDLMQELDAKRKEFQGNATLGSSSLGTSDRRVSFLHLGKPLHAMVTGNLTCCAYCKMAATVGWESATAIDTSDDIERRFDAVLASVIWVSNHVLDEPRSIWRITPDERTQIRGPDTPNGVESHQ